MPDADIQVTAGTGPKVDTRTVGAGVDEHRQVVVIGDPTTAGGVATVDPTTGMRVHVQAATQTQDAVYTPGGLLMSGGYRRDTDVGSPVSADGDVHPFIFNAIGRLKVSAMPSLYAMIGGAITASGQSVTADVSRASNVMIDMIATTLVGHNATFEGSLDGGTNWFQIQAVRSNANVIETTTGVLAATPVYAWELSVNALTHVRVRATAHTSGTATWRILPGAYATEPIPAAQVSATQPVSGTVTTVTAGAVAEDAVISGNPVQSAVRAHAAVPTAMSADNDVVRPWADRSGAQVVIPQPRQVRITLTPTISTTAYASGDVIGASMTFTGAALAAGRPGQVIGAVLHDDGKQKVGLELWLFLTAPTLVNADNGVFDITDANLATALPIGVIDFLTGNYRDSLSGSIAMGTFLGGPVSIPYVTTATANIFGALVSRGTPTYAATDLTIDLICNQF